MGGHKSAVTALLALPSREPGGPDALISAGADGTVAVWEPSASGSAVNAERFAAPPPPPRVLPSATSHPKAQLPAQALAKSSPFTS